MKKLAWVGLPPGITEEQFSSFVGEHPGLKIVELITCGGITDLSPLQRLTGLTGLIGVRFSGTFDAVDQVDQLKTLEFLGLPIDTFGNDTESLARIRTALPHALVVPASPFCLGRMDPARHPSGRPDVDRGIKGAKPTPHLAVRRGSVTGSGKRGRAATGTARSSSGPVAGRSSGRPWLKPPRQAWA